MSDSGMTEEQRKFLEECEEEFKDRYSEKDAAFMKIKNAEMSKPPIVDPWYTRQGRSYDWAQQNQGKRNRNWERRNNDRNERIERHAGRHRYRTHKPY